MGSSGSAKLLEAVLDSLVDLNVSVIASTAGAPIAENRWRNVWFAQYLPGELAAARAEVVICNGGSPTSQQALASGVPVLGICSNMDQMLNMQGIVEQSLGISLRADRAPRRRIESAVRFLIEIHKSGSAFNAKDFKNRDLTLRFSRYLDAMITGQVNDNNQRAIIENKTALSNGDDNL
jgi:UDP:flavonoid glycosyltransferase YjiC (YdhE family)